MKNPILHVSLQNKSKEEIINVLQGLSRYIGGIHIELPLLQAEGSDIIVFLYKRYPEKDIILNLSELTELSDEMFEIVKKSPLKNVIFSTELFARLSVEQITEIQTKKREIIVSGKEFDWKKLDAHKIKKLFYLGFANDELDKKALTKEEFIQLEKHLSNKNFHFFVGFINVDRITHLKSVNPLILVNNRDISYSFVPIDTCKKLSFKINAEFKNWELINIQKK